MTGILMMAIFAVISGTLVSLNSTTSDDLLRDTIDSLLPQTQCGRCNYPSCKLYSTAIIQGQADINQCPPGGDATIATLARISGQRVKPLNPKHGQTQTGAVAVIDEQACIGCVKCIQACPVDAILGAAKQMHSVLSQVCTGCELCIPPCPMNCISMQNLAET